MKKHLWVRNVATLLILVLFLYGYYNFVTGAFSQKTSDEKISFKINEQEKAEERLGTVLWHSDNKEGNYSYYCYFPKAGYAHNGLKQEILVKKVEKLSDCDGWYGIIEGRDGSWLSRSKKFLMPHL
ncbi:hypothetical protein HYS91_05340 [Candidatus Daviesbacteria bacterium]|nr:hypothetical protein [Candidatus Daviesbacteria bacterium]